MQFRFRIVALSVALVLCSASFAQGVQTDCSQLRGSMEISGHGQLEAAPDEARIYFNLSSQKQKAADARKNCEDTALKFQKSLEALKLDKKQVLAGSITLQPHYTYDKKQEKQIQDGYTAERHIEVRTADFTLIPAITDAAMDAGVTEIGGIEYRIKDESALKKQADELAIKDARDQAQRLAEGFGVKLLKPCSLSFSQRQNHPGYLQSRMMSVNAVALGAENSSEQAEYNPENMTIESYVRAVFAID